MMRIAAAVPIVTLLGGCISSPYGLNESLSVGAGTGTAKEPSYTPETLRPTFIAGGAADAPGAGGVSPSTLTIDRSNWVITRVDVPTDRAEHQPIYTRSLFENNEIARNRGLYPTAVSANQINHASSEDAQRLEAMEAPLAAAADLVLFVPRAIMNAPWDPVRTGYEPYRRAPAPRGSISPVLTTSKPAQTKAGGKLGIADPAAAPVRVPVGEYQPVNPPNDPGATPRR